MTIARIAGERAFHSRWRIYFSSAKKEKKYRQCRYKLVQHIFFYNFDHRLFSNTAFKWMSIDNDSRYGNGTRIQRMQIYFIAYPPPSFA